MSQITHVIGDQSGTSFLANLNAVTAALDSHNSGATEPATKFAYMPWADTANDVMKIRNAANNAWISLFTISTGKSLLAAAADTATTAAACSGNAATATMANRTDSGEVTVTAHATTGDIFAAAANSLLWDDAGGAITTTAFPAASKAGLVRDCRCNGASKFTAGANLEIEGIPSGTTITLANKASFTVRAITTTLFKMTYSASGTFTATGTGFTTPPTVTAKYTVINGSVSLMVPAIAGLGDAGITFTITGLPPVIVPSSIRGNGLIRVYDNDLAQLPGVWRVDGSIIRLGLVSLSSGFTPSKSKGMFADTEFHYTLG